MSYSPWKKEESVRTLGVPDADGYRFGLGLLNERVTPSGASEDQISKLNFGDYIKTASATPPSPSWWGK